MCASIFFRFGTLLNPTNAAARPLLRTGLLSPELIEEVRGLADGRPNK
jgi:hypothetical protein